MRIGIVTGEYPPMQGGVGAYSHILAGELARAGHRIFVFSSSQAQDERPGVTLTRSVVRWDFGSLRAIYAWAGQNNLEVVNIQFQTAAYGMSPWIHFLPDVLRRVPIVTTFHDLRFPYLFPKAGKLRDWIVRHLARASDGLIVTNHEDLTRLADLPRVRLIPIGSNILKPLPHDFDAAEWRAKAGAQPGDLLLVYFGLVNRSKGIETLLTSVANLRTAGLPVRLAMIGGGAGSSDPSNAPFVHEMNALMDGLNLQPYIHQTGYLDDQAVGAYLSASDAVALPFLDGASYRRGSLMAAIHYGCAIVSTLPSVHIPTFKDGDNMLFVPPDDTASLENALLRLYESPELRQRLRQGAAELADEFRWDTIAQAYVDFFQKLIEEGS